MCYQWAAYLQILIPKPNYPRHKNVIKIPCKFIYVLSWKLYKSFPYKAGPELNNLCRKCQWLSKHLEPDKRLSITYVTPVYYCLGKCQNNRRLIIT